jgi:hypothetical protein
MNSQGKIKFERIKDMAPIKREIIRKIFEYLDRKRNSDQWWQYKGEFKYEDKEYTLEVEARLDNHMLSYRNLFIEYKQVVIDIDDMVSKGLLN